MKPVIHQVRNGHQVWLKRREWLMFSMVGITHRRGDHPAVAILAHPKIRPLRVTLRIMDLCQVVLRAALAKEPSDATVVPAEDTEEAK